MRPGILSSGYVPRPASDAARERMSAAHRRRMGIPDGCVRVYGVHIVQETAARLRPLAYDVARRRGYASARQFVLTALETDNFELPYVVRPYRGHGPYLPPREFVRLKLQKRAVRSVATFARRMGEAIRRARREEALRQKYALLEWKREQRVIYKACKTIERFAKWSVRRSRGRIDWVLAEQLLEAHVSREEIAAYFGVSFASFRRNLYERKRDGLSAFGRGGAYVWRKRA